jgi:DNA primase
MLNTTEIKNRVILSSVIKKAVQLKGNGPKYLGLCPFHEEKTPSFNVNDKLGRFKCFGCGASGDVFEFTMRLRGLSFREAVEELSGNAGIKLKSQRPNSHDDATRALLKAQSKAHEYFIAHIKSAKNPARDYLVSRGLNSAMIEQAALGFGGLSASEFFNFLKNHNISQDLAAQAGLIKYQGSNPVPMFLGRLIFPIRRFDGKVVAFGGRSFLEHDNLAPKYVNTHAYALYEKRNNFYGLFESKHAILKGQTPVLVEGYFDAMALWALGIPALALCGTALSSEHIALLKRLVSRLVICFDGDAAGFRALRSSLALLWSKNITTNVMTLDRKDPGEYLSDLVALKARLSEQQDALCFVIDQARLIALGDISHRVHEIDQLLPILMNIARPLVRRQYVAYLAKQLHEDPSLLWAEITNRLKNKKEPPRALEAPVRSPIIFSATEKLLAQILALYPDLAGDISEALRVFISGEFKEFLDHENPAHTAMAQAIKAERALAPEISLEEAREVLKALEHKLVRLAAKAELKKKRSELQAAEKAKDFSLVLKSLKEQSKLLAQLKPKEPLVPVVQTVIAKVKPLDTFQPQEDDDWL